MATKSRDSYGKPRFRRGRAEYYRRIGWLVGTAVCLHCLHKWRAALEPVPAAPVTKINCPICGKCCSIFDQDP